MNFDFFKNSENYVVAVLANIKSLEHKLAIATYACSFTLPLARSKPY